MLGLSLLDVPTAFRLAGLLYVLVSLAVYLVLRRNHDCRSLMAWCGGSGLFGLGFLLIGWRHEVPDWASIHLSNVMVLASFGLRISSLRLEAERPACWRASAGLVVASFGVFMLADAQSEGLRVLVLMGLHVLGSAWLAWAAADIWQRFHLRVARAMAIAFAALATSVLWAAAEVQIGGWPFLTGNTSIAVTVALLTAFSVSLFGNLGFMGMVIERSYGREVAHSRELERMAAQRQAAERHASQLLGWLAERDELLRLLAHEVRQPLNNATAALQAARQALRPAETDHAAVGERVQRAEQVLGQIIGTLDNNLAATALLASPDRVERRDVDVDTLTTLALGDLDATQRGRVQVHSGDAMRTALMDAGLMRLALRNLLSNALAYSAPDTPVVLKVSDLEEPLSLVFEVLDQGPGIEPTLAARLYQRGSRGPLGGHGLGLYVVQRVMELHGGTVDQQPRPGGGTVFRLLVPQDMSDRRRTHRAVPDQPSISSARKM